MSKKDNFKLYSKYYDILYKSKNTIAECDYILNLIKKFNDNKNDILEFGAGSGRHGQVMIEKGIIWSGIEKSESMIAIGKSKGLSISKGDIGTHLKLKKKADTVLSIFHVISYLDENEPLLNSFKNANDVLENEGLFIFDIWYSPAVYNEKPERRIKKVSSSEVDITRIATPTVYWNNNTVNVHYDIEIVEKKTLKKIVLSEDHLMRHFSLPELKMIASITGFELIHSEEWLTGKIPSKNTWGVTCVLKKHSNYEPYSS